MDEGEIISLGLKTVFVRNLSRARNCVSALPYDSVFSELWCDFHLRQSLFFLTIPCDGYHGLANICNKEEPPSSFEVVQISRMDANCCASLPNRKGMESSFFNFP